MRKQLAELRASMQDSGIHLYIVPDTDPHGSEYVNDHFKFREYVSGFTGSAGTLMVTQDFAGLWTDGRYFIQAAHQLEDSGITLMKLGEDGVPSVASYLEAQPEGMTVGFDARLITEKQGRDLESKFQAVCDVDLADRIWHRRPDIIPMGIYELPHEVTGETSTSKLRRLREYMGNADYILISSLDEIAWLYNLRGADIAHIPVFYGFALISREDDMLYVMDADFASRHPSFCKEYDQLRKDLAKLKNCTVMLDERTASFALRKAFDPSVTILAGRSPVEYFKAVKNEKEIASTRNAHIKDGAAMVEFISWLKHAIGKQRITERLAADRLAEYRRKQGAYDLSFEAIVGYEANGAIVHYAITEESDAVLQPKGFLLVDSGGQYHDGTTDITRTIALGPLDRERKRNYTAVLKGHIELALSRFGEETTGAQLDAAARKPLQELGLDYGHGTGHGVGHMLSVHEGPNTISKRAMGSHILPGMITSDEPGVYLEGKYGIRIENELLCIRRKGEASNGERDLAFEAITLCPYERDAIEKSMLTKREIAYINAYHEKVYHVLKGLVSVHAENWLQGACRRL